MRLSNILIGVVTLAMAANLARAQSALDVRLLTLREMERLNKQTREAYDQGVTALDHVDAASAIQKFDQASQLDPEAMELHFLASRLAMLRGRMMFRDEAAKYYDTAEKALDRVAKQKDMSPLMKQRYETAKKQIVDEKKKLEARDARRKAIGDAFRKLYAQETYTEEQTGEAAAPAPALKRTGSGGLTAGERSTSQNQRSSVRSEGENQRSEPRYTETPRREGRGGGGGRAGGRGGGRRG